MESHLSRPPLPRLQGNRTWSFQRLAWTRGAPGALSWTTDRDVDAACIHTSLYVHIVRRFVTMTMARKSISADDQKQLRQFFEDTPSVSQLLTTLRSRRVGQGYEIETYPAGLTVQNIRLAAEAIGLGAWIFCGFFPNRTG